MRAARAMPGAFPIQVPVMQVASATFARGGAAGKALVPFRIAAGIASTATRDAIATGPRGGGLRRLPSDPGDGRGMACAQARAIHEQNGVPGRVNRHFAPRVDRGGLRGLAHEPAGRHQCRAYRQSGARGDPAPGPARPIPRRATGRWPSGVRRQPGRAALCRPGAGGGCRNCPRRSGCGFGWPSRPGPRMPNGSRLPMPRPGWRPKSPRSLPTSPTGWPRRSLSWRAPVRPRWPISRRSGGRRS
jgi:hypothetical protein